MEALNMLDSFHFLRPWWLLFTPIWIWLSYRVWHTGQQQNGWSSLCDPALLSYLVGESSQQKSTSKLWLAAISMAGLIASIALAGPVWKQLPQPVFQATSAMILVLDLSRSMDAADVKPSRLIRAKQKLQDILAARTEGQTGLIVFAGSAFDVVPLTTDNKAILSLLSSLDTSMMPAQGSLASLALKRAKAMFQRGAIQHGSVVMLCDGVDADAVTAALDLSKAGHQVSILAVGTAEGAPIPLRSDQATGGFMKDSAGNIIIPRIDQQQLAAVTRAGDGLFQHLRLDDADVQQLPGLTPSHFSNDRAAKDSHSENNQLQTDQWQEEGSWLVILLLPLCLLAFRRGVLLALLLMPLSITLAWPTSSQAIEWENAWQTADQKAQALMQQNNANEAAKLFKNKAWKAAALYRAGKYDAAAQLLANAQAADNQYNKANALARAGKLQQALKAYDAALQAYAEHHATNNQDAQFNRNLVEQALKKQQHKKNNKPKDGKGDKQDQQGKKPSSEPSPEQSGDKSDKRGQPQDKAQKESQSASSDKQDASKQEQQEQNKLEQGKGQSNKDQDKADQTQSSPSKAAKEEQKKADKQAQKQGAVTDAKEMEKQHAQQQMLRRIPDDPGGLLRRKFKYQYQQQEQQSGSQQAW